MLALLIIIFTPLELAAATTAMSPIKRMPQLLNEIKEHPDNISAISEAADIYLLMNDTEGASAMASRLEEIACRCPDSINARWQSKLINGWVNIAKGNGNQALTHLNHALMIAQANDITVGVAESHQALGYCYSNLFEDFTVSIEHFTAAMQAARKLNDKPLLANVTTNLADVYLWKRDFSGVKYAEEALILAKEGGDPKAIGNAKLNIAHFYCYCVSKFDEVLSLVEEARQYNRRCGVPDDGEIALVEGEYYNSTENPHKAEKIFEEALNGSNLSPLTRVKLLIYLGESQLKLGHYARALETLTETHELTKNRHLNNFTPFLLSGIAYCHENLGNYKQALKYFKDYNHHNDSIWLSEQMRSLTTSRINNEIFLNESKLQRQKAELAAKRLHIILLAVIGVLLAIVATLLGFFYVRNKRLYNSIVTREQESIAREKLLRHALEQARSQAAETSTVADKAPSSKPLADEKVDDLMVRFNELMTTHRAYADPSTSIKGMAEALDTNRTYLSQAVNRTFGKSFPQVLAEYRIRAAIELISDTERNLPMKAVAAEVGFTSTSTFYSSFREIMGITPSKYRESLTGDVPK